MIVYVIYITEQNTVLIYKSVTVLIELVEHGMRENNIMTVQQINPK